jgi:hypothetical protein
VPHRDESYGGVTVLGSAAGGRYPSGNSLLVSGTAGAVLVDPSLEVHHRGGLPASVDLVVVSHAHEDHLAGLHLFPDLPVLAHPAEVAAVRSPDVLAAGSGMGPDEAGDLAGQLRDTFHHVGVVEGRQAFRTALDGLAAVIHRRDDVLLELLRQPRTLEDVVAHRLVYRPHVRLPFADAVERRTAVLHLARLERRGLVARTAEGFLTV